MPGDTPLRLEGLRKRSDFLRAAKGQKWVTAGFVLQARPRNPVDADSPRAGFTASRKVGGAVSRNFARRRLKEAARQVLSRIARPGVDYVLIARGGTGEYSFRALLQDLDRAVHMVHKRLDAPHRCGLPAEDISPESAGAAPATQPDS